MHGILGKAAEAATDVVARAVSETGITAQTGSGRDLVIANAAKTVLGKDAGLHLHYITGFPERTCYRYASGEREPPMDFLRALFHSPQGEPFLLAFMEGCTAPWWRSLREQRRVGIAAITEYQKHT